MRANGQAGGPREQPEPGQANGQREWGEDQPTGRTQEHSRGHGHLNCAYDDEEEPEGQVLLQVFRHDGKVNCGRAQEQEGGRIDKDSIGASDSR
jgi:hypothetical protein